MKNSNGSCVPSLRSSIEFFQTTNHTNFLMDEERAKEVFEKHAKDNRVRCDNVKLILKDIESGSVLESMNIEKIARTCAGNKSSLTFEEFISLWHLIKIQNPSRPESPTKKFITQSRPYLKSGLLGKEHAILEHIEKLEELRKKYEMEGNYKKAESVSKRLHEFKTFEAERRKKDMSERHKKEIEIMEDNYISDQKKFDEQWDNKFNEFDRDFENNAKRIKRQHDEELKEFYAIKQAKKPKRPQYSTELLNKRKIETHLVKQGDYNKAYQIKTCADQLEAIDMKTTMAAFDTEYRLKEQKIINKHKLEFDALKQKSLRIRAEMEIQKLEECEQRVQRYKNVFSELQNLQKLEMAYLENFIENQVLAGKRGAMKDSLFRYKNNISIV